MTFETTESTKEIFYEDVAVQRSLLPQALLKNFDLAWKFCGIIGLQRLEAHFRSEGYFEGPIFFPEHCVFATILMVMCLPDLLITRYLQLSHHIANRFYTEKQTLVPKVEFNFFKRAFYYLLVGGIAVALAEAARLPYTMQGNVMPVISLVSYFLVIGCMTFKVPDHLRNFLTGQKKRILITPKETFMAGVNSHITKLFLVGALMVVFKTVPHEGLMNTLHQFLMPSAFATCCIVTYAFDFFKVRKYREGYSPLQTPVSAEKSSDTSAPATASVV